MARINIEDIWFIDPRRDALSKLVGSTILADGLALHFWRLAQTYLRQKKLVPLHIFEATEHSDAFIAAGLAEVREDGVYIRGQSEHFDWLNARAESGHRGGVTSSRRPRDEKGRLLPKDSKQTPSKTKQTQASSSSSFSSSFSSSSSSSGSTSEETKKEIHLPAKKPKRRETPEALQARAKLADFWRRLYANRFGHEYLASDSAFFKTTIKRIHESLGTDKAVDMMRAYVAWNDPRVASRGHPLHWLLSSLHALEAQRRRPEATLGIVAQGRATERVLTETQQRLAEMNAYARLTAKPNARLPEPTAQRLDQPSGGLLQDGAQGRVPDEHGPPPDDEAVLPFTGPKAYAAGN